MQMSEVQTVGEAQYRSLAVVWFVFVISQVFFFAFCVLVTSDVSPFFLNFRWVIAGLALTFVIDSFVWKRKMLSRATEKQDPSEVNRAYIVAFCLSEATALVGFVLKLEADFRYFYILFAAGAIATVLHFPRKERVLMAYKTV